MPPRRRKRSDRKGLTVPRVPKGYGTKAAAALAQSTERRQQVWQLRLKGLSLSQIGAALGITKQSAHALLENALHDAAAEHKAMASRWIELELARLDELHAALHHKALAGDHQAVDAIGRLMARRAKLLGLDAPDRVDHTSGGKPLDTARLELASRAARLAGDDASAAAPAAPGEPEPRER